MKQKKKTQLYKLVRHPKLEEYKKEPWFEDEAILFHMFGPEAYLIPLERCVTNEYLLVDTA